MSKHLVKLLPVIIWEADNEPSGMTALEQIILDNVLVYILGIIMAPSKMSMSSSLESMNVLLYKGRGG